MVIGKIGKILLTDIAKTSKFCEKPFCLAKKTLPKLESLKLAPLTGDVAEFSRVKYSADEIRQAYREYAKSPYVNAYMRRGLPLSENSEKVVNCLKQAIDESEPLTGKFYRGLSSGSDEEAVRYILNNSGFTSTTPEAKKNFAECFAIGHNSALVEFDLKKPIKGFKGCDYEVLFAPNTFTADKYEITKVKDGFFRVTEKTCAEVKPVKCASITSHYDEGGTLVFGNISDNYVKTTTEFVPEETVVARFGPNKGKTRIIPAHEERTQYMLPHHHIDKLWTGGKGTGTSAVQRVVEESLNDSRTMGRVTLDACCIDGKTSPAGFYYKLGFRSKDPQINERLAKWLAEGGLKEKAPFETGIMYLPKENIEQCLNYVPKH